MAGAPKELGQWAGVAELGLRGTEEVRQWLGAPGVRSGHPHCYNCSVILQGFHIFWLRLVFFPVGDGGAQHLSWCVLSPSLSDPPVPMPGVMEGATVRRTGQGCRRGTGGQVRSPA